MSKRIGDNKTDEATSDSDGCARDVEAEDVDSHLLTHSDYTVGWICALTKERVAAILMLDETHPDLPNPPDDRNSYTLGAIGKHNIVIACLPKGQYGTIPAAKVALWMTNAFPSIRIGLMVGIGGGIPSKVRLGDVVISIPVDKDPGVIQWDMGKAEDGGHFARTGSLNNPPTVLLAAATKLETHHAIYGSKVGEYLGKVARRYPKLELKYTRCETLIDPLAADKEDADLNQMQVHYGLIASGNQVIKDSAVRDQLDSSLGGNVLCVEMEAAGLMNDFPCIVIRGICDYADCHKTNDWQEYAAMVAAGCAKELLELVEPYDIQRTLEARNVMNALENVASSIENIIQVQEKQKRDEEFSRLFTWLSPLTPSVRHSENRKQRLKGTGTWLLEDPKFLTWSSEEAIDPVLCCFGDPGVGKTILCSLVIDTLAEEVAKGSNIGLGYVYCDYRDRNVQTVENIIGAVLVQLLRSMGKIPSKILDFHQTQLQKDLPFSSTDAKYLLDVSGAQFDKIFICLDALDELSDLPGVLKIFRERPSNVRLFLTGRPHIGDAVQKHLEGVDNLFIQATSDDIERFIEHEIGGPNDAESDAMDDQLHKSILTKIAASSKGNFLLTVLQTRNVLQNLTIGERERSLEIMASNLGEAFAGTFVRMNEQSPALAHRAAHIIAWIHLAHYPLTVNAILCSLTVKKGDESFDHSRIPIGKTLLRCCCGLVTVDEKTQTLRLVHYSLQEYLEQQSEIFNVSKEEWHGRIAATLLTYLEFGFDPYKLDKGRTRPLVNELFIPHDVQGAFHIYGATQWGHHLRQAQIPPADVLELATKYLCYNQEQKSQYFKFLHDYMCRTNRVGRNHPLSPDHKTDPEYYQLSSFPCHVAAFFGLPDLLTRLGSTGLDLDARNTSSMAPLAQAARHGHSSVVKLLLAHPGVEVNSRDVHQDTPLIYAARFDHDKVAQLLLAHPAVDINLEDKKGLSALSIAIICGSINVLQLLLAHANIDVKGWNNPTKSPLIVAAEVGNSKAVQVLLRDARIDVNFQGVVGKTSLMIAAETGHIDIVRLLTARPEIHINQQNDFGETVLTDTVRSAHSDIIRVILAHPALEINFRNRLGQTALCNAARRGVGRVVRLLLEYPGIDVNLADKSGRTPLWLAASIPSYKIVRLLLAFPDVDVNMKDTDGMTALMRVAKKKPWTHSQERTQIDIVRLLLAQPGVEINLDESTLHRLRELHERFPDDDDHDGTNSRAVLRLLTRTTNDHNENHDDCCSFDSERDGVD